MPINRAPCGISRKCTDGSPELYFRVFYCWNSEVGAKMLGTQLLSPGRLPVSQSPTCRGLGRVLICGRPARCKRFFEENWQDAAICPASDGAAKKLRARMGVRRPEPNHKRVL